MQSVRGSYIFWVFFRQGVNVLSFMIIGYVWQILGRGSIFGSLNPWAPPKRPILNKVKVNKSRYKQCGVTPYFSPRQNLMKKKVRKDGYSHNQLRKALWWIRLLHGIYGDSLTLTQENAYSWRFHFKGSWKSISSSKKRHEGFLK